MLQLARRRTSTSVAAAVIALPLLVGIASLTLFPERIEQRHPGFVHRVLTWAADAFGPMWGTTAVADVVANTLVFVPVGILAYLIIPRRAWIASLLTGPALATAIECFQLLFLPGRDAAVHDVLAASVGSAFGVGVAAGCTLLTARRMSPETSA